MVLKGKDEADDAKDSIPHVGEHDSKERVVVRAILELKDRSKDSHDG